MNQDNPMPRKPKKPKQHFPGVNESIVDYMNSKAYKESFTNITISSYEEQEEDNYVFWAHLTPKQRLELHFHMITGFFADELKKKKGYHKIEFDATP